MSVLTVGAAGAGGAYDYTCDGAADEVQINAAIGAAGVGGTVQLSAGTFACAADITATAGVSLLGTTGTILQFEPGAVHRLIARGSQTIADLDLRGPVELDVYGGSVSLDRLVSRQAVYGIGAFVIYANSKTIANVAVTDCSAIDTSGFGFFISGEGTAPTVTGVTFTRCAAINCGLSHDADDATLREWVTGFNFAEAGLLTIGDIHAVDCTATRCYESGFHCEGAPAIASPCTMTRCTATGCGIDKPSPSFGAGLLATPSWTLTDCISTGCYRGFYIGISPTNPHAGEVAALVRCAAVDPVQSGYHIGGGSFGGIVDPVLADCAVTGVAAPGHIIWIDYVTGAQITDLRATGCTGGIYADHSSGTTITYYLAPFRASIAAPVTGEAVAFTDQSANDGLTAWSWDFGDGSGSSAQHPTHAYPTAGVYPVTLTAGGNTVSGTVTVVPGVSYGGARLSEADLAPLDHDPIANATDLHNGRVGLQGSPVSRRTWTINALADDRAEIEALAALKGQHLVLNINGTEYPGTMIRPPLLETQLTPAALAYQVGFVQETRR